MVLPYAYFLNKSGKLKSSKSSLFTKELYYFSENHEEVYTDRKCNKADAPNKFPHVTHLNYDEYIPPPYKAHYKNNIFIYEKPLLIVHNKYNTEWGGPPINYIDTQTLSEIFKLCRDKYKIIYIRPTNNNIVHDNSKIYDLNETDVLKEYGIIDGVELYNKIKSTNSINNFNHFQLLLHANCENFISVQGGNCVLASYFGGKNVIYAKRGDELNCNSYNGHYKKYSGCEISSANNYKDFIDIIKKKYL